MKCEGRKDCGERVEVGMRVLAKAKSRVAARVRLGFDVKDQV